VSPILNAEERRRLVGNDVAMLFYFDEPDPSVLFDPSGIDTFGEVPCLFTIVQPFNDGTYRVGFCSKKNIPDYGPPSPSILYQYVEVKNHVLTKLYNGLVLSNQCPPLNRLFTVPRRATMNDIAEKWIPKAKAASSHNSPQSQRTGADSPLQKPADLLFKGKAAAGSALNLGVTKVQSVSRSGSRREPSGPKTKVADAKKLSTLKKKLSKNGLTPETTKEIQKMWQKLDQDGSGELDLIEAKIFFGNVYDWLSKGTKKLDPVARAEKREFTIGMWIQAFDENGDGQISWQEFLAGLNSLLQTDSI